MNPHRMSYERSSPPLDSHRSTAFRSTRRAHVDVSRCSASATRSMRALSWGLRRIWRNLVLASMAAEQSRGVV